MTNSSSASGFYPGNLMWDLSYKHLHIFFTLQVAVFRVVLAVFSFLFFQMLFSLI